MRKKLQQYRRQRGLTQAQTAELIGVGEEMYRHMEAGRRTGIVTHWVTLSKILGIPIELLLEQAPKAP